MPFWATLSQKLFGKKIPVIILNGNEVLSRFKIKITQKEFTFLEHKFIVNLSRAIPISKKKRVLFYDFNISEPLYFRIDDSSINSAILNEIISKTTIRALFGSDTWFTYCMVSIAINVFLVVLIYLFAQGFIHIPIKGV
jgi:hypothetical protein